MRVDKKLPGQLKTLKKNLWKSIKSDFKVADLVEERSNDTIGFFDESEGKFEEDWIKKIWLDQEKRLDQENSRKIWVGLLLLVVVWKPPIKCWIYQNNKDNVKEDLDELGLLDINGISMSWKIYNGMMMMIMINRMNWHVWQWLVSGNWVILSSPSATEPAFYIGHDDDGYVNNDDDNTIFSFPVIVGIWLFHFILLCL